MVQGERVKEQRIKLGLKQIDLAKKIGVSTATISNLEKEKTIHPNYRKVLLFAYVLSCTTDYLCGLASVSSYNRDDSINPFKFFDTQTLHDDAGIEALLFLDPALCRTLVACLRLDSKKRYVIRAMIDTYLDAVQNDE